MEPRPPSQPRTRRARPQFAKIKTQYRLKRRNVPSGCADHSDGNDRAIRASPSRFGMSGDRRSGPERGWSRRCRKPAGREVRSGFTDSRFGAGNTVIDPSQDEEVIGNDVDDEGPVEVLLRLAASARFFRSADGRLYAQVPVGRRREIYGLKSAALRDWLSRGYFCDCRRLPSDRAIHRVVDALEAIARFEGGTPSFFVRVGRDSKDNGSAFYVDLGDPSGQAIKIGPEGWSVVDRPGVPFRRPEGLLAFPIPCRDGSIDLLRPYVNLKEPDFRLLIGWLAAVLRPVGPYPILVIMGEQGSAKSTLARILRLLVDPQARPFLAGPKSTRDMMVTAVNGWLLAYDNISVIPGWLSDNLCRLVFGGGFAARTRFATDVRSVIHAQRPVMLNGIEDFVRRGDMVDRTVFLHLPPIAPEGRRAENEFWSSFQADYPRILGGVLDAVVDGLRELPSVPPPELPRMADHAQWGEAVDLGLGWVPETLRSTDKANRQEAAMTALEDSAVGNALLQIAPVWRSGRAPLPSRRPSSRYTWAKRSPTRPAGRRRPRCWPAGCAGSHLGSAWTAYPSLSPGPASTDSSPSRKSRFRLFHRQS